MSQAIFDSICPGIVVTLVLVGIIGFFARRAAAPERISRIAMQPGDRMPVRQNAEIDIHAGTTWCDTGEGVSDEGLPVGLPDPYGQVRIGRLISAWGDAHAAKCAAEREQARLDLMYRAYQAYPVQKQYLEADTLNERLKISRVIDE